jgi:hypothetical protein
MHRRLYRKVYRNEPCPCGSGKKMKHCDCEERAMKDDTVDMSTDIVYRGGEPIGQLKENEKL